jgi:hypothetical protein
MNKLVLKEKIEILSRGIINTRDDYFGEGVTEKQKGLLETLVGAGIWYLPSSIELYNGMISEAAFNAIQVDPYGTKLVEEHGYPRKVAGNRVYNEYFDQITYDGEGLMNLYINNFGRFNLVLKEENNKLKPYQKVSSFTNEEVAYQQAGINLMPFSQKQYNDFKRLRRKRAL